MATELATANETHVSSDSAVPSDALDSPSALNFWEPEEEQAKPEDQNHGIETDREPAEVRENQEADTDQETQSAEDQSDEAKAATPAEPEDSVVIAMPGGQRLELKELKSGYMRDRDYRHKTTDIANKRRELEAHSTRVTHAVNAVSELLMSQVPRAPDPSLTLTDPLAYIQQKALHDQGMERISSIIDKANSVQSVTNTLTQEQQSEIVQSEIAKLNEAFPQTKTPEGQRKFFDASLGAAKELGFSDAELNQINDHRMFKVAYYASLGLKAEAARSKAALKVVNVPPVATQRRPTGPNASKQRANQEALSRLNRTGSIKDAMAVDFD